MTDKFKDTSLPITERVDNLLSKMTLKEKIGQLRQPMGWKAYKKGINKIEITEEFMDLLSDPGIGSLYGVLRADPYTEVTLEKGLSPAAGAELVNEIQRYAIENTRLGIPLLFGEECSHGHMAIGATVFPVPITLASTWNCELAKKMGTAIAAETRAQGGTATYSPILDVARDPRWGRTEETLGEDPYLCVRMGSAIVKGLQGDNLKSKGIAATVKHFAAYGCSFK